MYEVLNTFLSYSYSIVVYYPEYVRDLETLCHKQEMI